MGVGISDGLRTRRTVIKYVSVEYMAKKKRENLPGNAVPMDSGSFSSLPVPHNGEQLQRGCLVSWEIW